MQPQPSLSRAGLMEDAGRADQGEGQLFSSSIGVKAPKQTVTAVASLALFPFCLLRPFTPT